MVAVGTAERSVLDEPVEMAAVDGLYLCLRGAKPRHAGVLVRAGSVHVASDEIRGRGGRRRRRRHRVGSRRILAATCDEERECRPEGGTDETNGHGDLRLPMPRAGKRAFHKGICSG